MRVTVHASYIIRIIPITFKFIHNALLVYQWGFCFRDVKINWCDRERIETKFFFATFLVAAWFFCKGDGRTEFKISINFIYFISVIHFCITVLQISFATDMSSLFSHPLCVARTCILLAVFCYQILSLSSEMSKIHLMEGRDRWNNIFYFNLIWNFLMNVKRNVSYQK